MSLLGSLSFYKGFLATEVVARYDFGMNLSSAAVITQPYLYLATVVFVSFEQRATVRFAPHSEEVEVSCLDIFEINTDVSSSSICSNECRSMAKEHKSANQAVKTSEPLFSCTAERGITHHSFFAFHRQFLFDMTMARSTLFVLSLCLGLTLQSALGFVVSPQKSIHRSDSSSLSFFRGTRHTEQANVETRLHAPKITQVNKMEDFLKFLGEDDRLCVVK